MKKTLMRIGKYKIPNHIYIMGRKITIRVVKQKINQKKDMLELGNADFSRNMITLNFIYSENGKSVYSNEEMVSVFLHEILHWKIHLLDEAMDSAKEEQIVIRDSEVLFQIINQII